MYGIKWLRAYSALIGCELNTQGYDAKSAPNPGLNGFQGLRPESTKRVTVQKTQPQTIWAFSLSMAKTQNIIYT